MTELWWWLLPFIIAPVIGVGGYLIESAMIKRKNRRLRAEFGRSGCAAVEVRIEYQGEIIACRRVLSPDEIKSARLDIVERNLFYVVDEVLSHWKRTKR